MKRSYECAYVTAIVDRGPVEKPAICVLHHEIRVLREMHAGVQIVPTDPQAGGATHLEVKPHDEYERMVLRYGHDPENKAAYVETVYGRYDDPRWEAALDRSEAYIATLKAAEVDDELGTFDDDEPDRETLETASDPAIIEELMTKADIVKFLDADGVKYDKRERKGALVDLLAEIRGHVFGKDAAD